MKKKIYTQRKTCRICDSPDLIPVLSLGDQYLINFPDGDTPEEGLIAPLNLILCSHPECSLVQLRESVDPDLMYRQFWYKSGINQTMRNALADITQAAQKKVALKKGDMVVDIGTNDGTLLRSYHVEGLVTVGFEPARNLVAEASVGTSKIINNYFNYKEFEKHFPKKKAKVITSIAMFYDLEDPNQFVRDVKDSMAKDGIWINQMNYLKSQLEQNAFDNISHEHLEYYSLTTLQYLLKQHQMEVFDVELCSINGGSLRVYIANRGAYPIQKSVQDLEASEAPLRDPKTYENFAKRIEDVKKKTRQFIGEELKKGKRVFAYGASTRGNTLLQYFGLDHHWITAAAERNPDKFGKKMVGTNIPIISESEARAKKPDYFFILPWSFIKEFIPREKEFFQNGGKFIVPLPDFKIIGLQDL